MPPKTRRIKRKKNHQIILILLLIAAGIFLFIGEFGKEDIPEGFFGIFKPQKKSEALKPEPPLRKRLPKVAIIIDDLGRSREIAEAVLNIESPLTLSILPQRRYSAWIAEEGNRLGRDVILHLPMEATRPLKLGEGGLFTWMSADEIAQIVREDIRSVPYIKGVGSHMGSAFTQNELAMRIVVLELKKQGLFFLDSFTISKSVGFQVAKAEGLKTLRRDVFLDNTDNLREIAIQWNKLIRIAKKRGYAIAIAHPRKNTLEHLQKVLRNNKEITVAPVSELMVDYGPAQE